MAVKIYPFISNKHFGTFLSFLPQERQLKIRSFVQEEDAYRSLLGDIITRYCLCRYYGLGNREIVIKRNKYGKPYIDDPDIHFNISHAGEWVVAAFGSKNIGIDIEKITPIDYQIAKRFFSADEYNDLNKLEGYVKNCRFFDYWSIKESYIKAIGKGLSISLGSFSVIFCEDKKIQIYSNGKFESVDIKQFYLDPEYKMAVCYKGMIREEVFRIIDTKELINYFNV